MSLHEFKNIRCDENRIIIDILKTMRHWMIPTILDVGAGLGDIARSAFPDLAAILLDVEVHPVEVSSHHQKLRQSFFEFRPLESAVRTALFIHVLQYLDDDLPRLYHAIRLLNAQRVITVTNDNSGVFGDLMAWASSHVPNANPERHVDMADIGTYFLHESVEFAATLTYPDFPTMAAGFATVLLDTDATLPVLRDIERQLVKRLSAPSILIQQTVRCYEQN